MYMNIGQRVFVRWHLINAQINEWEGSAVSDFINCKQVVIYFTQYSFEANIYTHGIFTFFVIA